MMEPTIHRISEQNVMVRALHALVRAQLRQRDYLTDSEVEELAAVEDELGRLPRLPLACCGSWKPDLHFPSCPTILNPQ